MGTSAAAAVAPARKPTFVLVHAAWHGGWCWKKLAPLLGARGCEVLTPTLTGLGERRHLARAEVGLETHVTDVASVLEYEDLHDVVLVGHSSSGAVITGVAHRVPARLAHLVYLDAFVPEDGQSVFDLLSAERRAALDALAQSEGGGWLLPRFAPAPWDTIVRQMWGVTASDDVQWLLDRLGPTPLGHFSEPVRAGNPAAAALPRTYIRCLQFTNPRFDRHAAVAKHTPGWRYRELPSSHHPFVTMPGVLADALADARR